MIDWRQELTSLDVGEVGFGVELRAYTSIRVGGPAEAFVLPTSEAQLAGVVAFAHRRSVPLRLLGNGSNVIVRDGGVSGIVVCTTKVAPALLQDGNSVTALAGVGLARFVTQCLSLGLVGMEFEVGIPGTIGGALTMNAGCHGQETYDFVKSVRTVEPDGRLHTWSRDEIQPSYRMTALRRQGVAITSGTFALEHGDQAALSAAKQRVRTYLRDRSQKQPQGLPNCGSVFKNPPGCFAGKLIEEAHGCGRRQGDAEISQKHGNFIVNHGSARAADVLSLIGWARKTVQDRKGVNLECEVEIMGVD